MLRPRHRQKSTLIYKTLGLAVLVGLALLPLLMEWGVSHHVLSLIPVQLITLAPPAAPKPLPVVPKPPPPVVVAVKPVAPPKPRVERVALLPPPVKVRVKPPVKPVAKPVIKPVVKPQHKPVIKLVIKPKPKPVIKSVVKPPVKPVASVKAPPKPPQTVKKPSPTIAALHAAHVAAARQVLAARRPRADALEKQAHQIAVAMAARRAETAGGAPDAPTLPPVLAPSDTPEGISATPTSEYVPAEAVFQSQPTVPDSLLVAPLHAVFRCRFVIHPNGSTTVQTLHSTGRPVLDKRALAAARRWRFSPARRDGKPVESTRIVEMTFNVRPAPGD
ncbi:MAG: TonB family protein [Armatimonadota bacterium]|nr:TonB family protein [Armatimonadota bacterium]